eukprot:GSA25T00019891001.1
MEAAAAPAPAAALQTRRVAPTSAIADLPTRGQVSQELGVVLQERASIASEAGSSSGGSTAGETAGA